MRDCLRQWSSVDFLPPEFQEHLRMWCGACCQSYLCISNQRGTISELGFGFLLMDASSQMWKLMEQYVKEAEETMGVLGIFDGWIQYYWDFFSCIETKDFLLWSSGLEERHSLLVRHLGFYSVLLRYHPNNQRVKSYCSDYIGLLNVGSSLVEVVSFLLELAFRPMSQPGLIKDLNSVQCGVANHMAQLGVMKLFKVKKKCCRHLHEHYPARGGITYTEIPLCSPCGEYIWWFVNRANRYPLLFWR